MNDILATINDFTTLTLIQILVIHPHGNELIDQRFAERNIGVAVVEVALGLLQRVDVGFVQV
ncbi:hypothetical protein ACK38U_02310 [Aeromonas veronii]